MRPATGEPFSMAYEEGEVTVRDQKVTAWKTKSREGAGLMTLLAQLTSNMPAKPVRVKGTDRKRLP